MLKLYYGNGQCNIEGYNEIRGVEISYSGKVIITKTCSDNFALIANDSRILIFPIGLGYLSNLFSYQGELNINSVLVANNEGKIMASIIKRVMDYSELILTKSEDITTLSENLNATNVHGKYNISKTKVINAMINDQFSDGELYLSDGTPYTGNFHIHTGAEYKIMTGSIHSEDSLDLYAKMGIPNKYRLKKSRIEKRSRSAKKIINSKKMKNIGTKGY